jgi:hypothetical protein
MTGFYGMGLYCDPDGSNDQWLHFHHPDGKPSFRGDRADCPLDHCGDVDLDAPAPGGEG